MNNHTVKYASPTRLAHRLATEIEKRQGDSPTGMKLVLGTAFVFAATCSIMELSSLRAFNYGLKRASSLFRFDPPRQG